jgi:branched-chain amino acid transport system substrate-binding protein
LQPTKEIIIGGSIPLSGKAAETGLNVHNGYKAAVKYINEVYGGVRSGPKHKLNLNMFDDANDLRHHPDQDKSMRCQFLFSSFGSNIVLPTCDIPNGHEAMVRPAGLRSHFHPGAQVCLRPFPRASRQFRARLFN